jgi:putative heme-binding domain-containing protein
MTNSFRPLYLALCGLLVLSACQSPPKVTSPAAPPAAAFELKDGDRVVFLGDTLIEREQYHGWVELMLTTRFPDRNVTFRNLGWSADIPDGTSRTGLSLLQAGLEPAGEGWAQLQKQIELTKPTVVVLGYGMASSFDGEAGLPKFKEDYNRLLDTLVKMAPGVRFVMLSPIRHETMSAPLPHPALHNAQLVPYVDAIREIALQRGSPFISLFDSLPKSGLTDNGIHLTDKGYRQAAVAIERGLGWSAGKWQTSKNAEDIRQLILKKNQLFFDRSRPQNMAYIFGFRKREQGQNAVEIPKFDPIIEAEEKKIAGLRDLKTPAPVHFTDARPALKTLTPQATPNFQVADGFEVTLWAENPQLAKPIQMNFDPQGRLWVVSSEVYPQIEPGQIANDKVLILEDTTGNGKADKSTVFVDGLMVPTGVAPGDGGVYVANSTELVHFKDTNGDGRADSRRVVLSGFGTEDTHHVLHTLRWGFDGRLYFNQSIYIRTHTETPQGVRRLLSGGIWRYNTPSMDMEVLFKGWVNTWGHYFDEYGQSFVTDGAGFQGVSWGMPGAMYFTYAKARRILESVSPGNYPKFSGLEVLYSKHFPDDWQGDVITGDFRAHRVVRFKVSEQGSGYVTKEMPDIVRTSEATFRPIDVKLGPDGALYIADWSNPIIQHGEVDFRDPRRDHEHGRIWRVTAKGRPLNPKPALVKAGNTALFEQLLSPNNFEAGSAKRLLTERGAAIVSDLNAWTRKQTDEKALLNALWMYEAVDRLELPLLNRLLGAQDGRVRAAATRVLSNWLKRVPNAAELLAQRVADDHPRVRVEAMRALSKIPTARSAELVLSVLDKPMDNFLDYALWLSVNDLAEPWIAAVKSGAWKAEGREKQLEFGLKAIEPSLASSVLAQLLQIRSLDRAGSGQWIELIGTAGGAPEVGKLYDQVMKKGFDDAATIRALAALNQASRLRSVKPPGALENIGQLFKHSNEKVRIEALKLAGTWKDMKQHFGEIVTLAGGPSTPAATRQAAFDALREIGGKGAIDGLTPLMESGRPPEIRRAAAIALASLNLKKSVPQIVEVLVATTDEKEALELWRSLLNVRGAGAAIAPALPKGSLPEVTSRTGLRAAQEGGRKEPELVTLLAVSGASHVTAENVTPEFIQQLAARATKEGDPARGELIYRRSSLSCMSCHAIGGAGGRVGPDMTSIGASAPVDYLVESLFLPNAKIKEGYHSVMIETKDDQEFSGILVRETEQEVFLRNAANQEVSVPKNKISKRANGLSLMPSGLVDALPMNERLDLVRFLSELGKPGSYDAAKGGVARAWKILAGTHRVEQFGMDKIVSANFKENDWQPLNALVDGRVLRDDVKETIKVGINVGVVGVYAATQFSTAKDGAVSFQLDNAKNVDVWIDGKSVKTTGGIKTTLASGNHTIVLRFDPKDLPEQVRLKSGDVAFLVN